MIKQPDFLPPLKISALIVAGGQGLRFSDRCPKQYVMIHNRTVLNWSLTPFLKNNQIFKIVVVIGANDHNSYKESCPSSPKLCPPVVGGATRTDSVIAGLKALESHNPDFVLIHDAARPGLSTNLLDRIIDALEPEMGIIPVLPVVDTLRQKTASGFLEEVPRENFLRVQTPQAFPYKKLLKSYERFQENTQHGHPPLATDDAYVFTQAHYQIKTLEGCPFNLKLTTLADLHFMEKILR